MTGGYTAHAKSEICVRRGGMGEETCGDADEMTRIYPGDVVRIPESPFWTVIGVVSPLSGFAYLH